MFDQSFPTDATIRDVRSTPGSEQFPMSVFTTPFQIQKWDSSYTSGGFVDHDGKKNGLVGNPGPQPIRPQLAMFKKLALTSLLSVVALSCASQPLDPGIRGEILGTGGFNFSRFIPIVPYPATGDVEIARAGAIVSVDIRLLTRTELETYLADTVSTVSVTKTDSGGSLSYLAGSVTTGKGSYRAIMDFSNFVSEELDDADGNRIGRARVGVGLRLIAEIKTKKSGIDLGSILKIGLAAERNELSGSLEVRVSGIRSTEINNLLPGILPAIDEGSIQAALEAMAAVKAKMYEADTTLSPRVLAVKIDKSAGDIGTVKLAVPNGEAQTLTAVE